MKRERENDTFFGGGGKSHKTQEEIKMTQRYMKKKRIATFGKKLEML